MLMKANSFCVTLLGLTIACTLFINIIYKNVNINRTRVVPIFPLNIKFVVTKEDTL